MRYQKQCLEKRRLGYKSFDKELLGIYHFEMRTRNDLYNPEN